MSLRFYAKSKFCVCFEVHIPVQVTILGRQVRIEWCVVSFEIRETNTASFLPEMTTSCK